MVYEYEKNAMLGEEMPAGLGLTDSIMFLSLRLLYRSLKVGAVDKQTALTEKGRLGYQKSILEKKLLVKERVTLEAVRLKKDVESAANDYAKNRTLENADKLYKAIYGMEPTKKEEV